MIIKYCKLLYKMVIWL